MKRDKIENQPCSRCKHFAEYKRTHSSCGVSCIDFKSFEPCEEEERMTTLEKIRAEIENTIDQEKLAFDGQFDKGLNMALQIIDKYEQQEPSEDAISRQAVLDALYDYWHDIYQVDGTGYDVFEDSREVIGALPPVTPQEPKTGHWTQTNEFFINRDGQFIYKFICSECKSLSYLQLPSVQPKQKTGRWILQPSNKEQGERDFIWWKCSECGQFIFSETEKDRREYHAFCGRCGARMESEEV